MILKLELLKRYCKEGFLCVGIRFTVGVHNLMNNCNLRSNSLKCNTNFNIFSSHSRRYSINRYVFSVLQNAEAFKLVFGIVLNIIVNRIGSRCAVHNKHANTFYYLSAHIIVVTKPVAFTVIVNIKNCRAVRRYLNTCIVSKSISVATIILMDMICSHYYGVGGACMIIGNYKLINSINVHHIVIYLIRSVGSKLVYCAVFYITCDNLTFSIGRPLNEYISRNSRVSRWRRNSCSVLNLIAYVSIRLS